MRKMSEVVVIGGGCVGAAIAWRLTRRGVRDVQLLEKENLASGSTGRSTAIIRTHYTHEVLARIALEARIIFERFVDEVGGDCGFRESGFLILNPGADREVAAANVEMHRAIGIDASLLEPGDIRQIEPRIATDDIGIAVWEPHSGQADPDGTTKAFAAAARAGGAEVVTGVRVTGIRTSGHRVVGVSTNHGDVAAQHVVVATGYWSASLLAPLGVDLPITPTGHTIATIRRPAGFGPPHPIVSDRVLGSYYMPEGESLTLIGTTGPDGSAVTNLEVQPTPASQGFEQLAERLLTRFPTVGDAELLGGWTGVYDCSPDLQPFLGPVPEWDGLHIAAGFSGHGFKLSPVAGDLVASGIVGSPRPELTFFSLSRFAANALITAANTYSVPTLG